MNHAMGAGDRTRPTRVLLACATTALLVAAACGRGSESGDASSDALPGASPTVTSAPSTDASPDSSPTLARASSVTDARDRSGDTRVPRVAAIRARLFLNKSSGWSDDMLASGAADLRNSNAGPDASNATLVIVEVSGEPGGNYTGYFGAATKYAVRLVAREGGAKSLLDESQLLPVLNAQGSIHLAFLLHQGGCEPVTLRVSVVGAVTGPPIERTLAFTCGE